MLTAGYDKVPPVCLLAPFGEMIPVGDPAMSNGLSVAAQALEDLLASRKFIRLELK